MDSRRFTPAPLTAEAIQANLDAFVRDAWALEGQAAQAKDAGRRRELEARAAEEWRQAAIWRERLAERRTSEQQQKGA